MRRINNETERQECNELILESFFSPSPSLPYTIPDGPLNVEELEKEFVFRGGLNTRYGTEKKSPFGKIGPEVSPWCRELLVIEWPQRRHSLKNISFTSISLFQFYFSDAVGQFTTCLTSYSTPIGMCINCIIHWGRINSTYEELKHKPNRFRKDKDDTTTCLVKSISRTFQNGLEFYRLIL